VKKSPSVKSPRSFTMDLESVDGGPSPQGASSEGGRLVATSPVDASTRLRQSWLNAVPEANPYLWRLPLEVTVVGKPSYVEQPV
jgi:hypothetical protein